MENQTKTTVLHRIEDRLEILFSKHVISLIIICTISLSLRVYFTRFEFPLESQDAFIYLLQAQQILREGGISPFFPLTYGWQAFLSFFFLPFSFDNNQSYMTILRIVSISVSVLTIPVVYVFGKKILEKRYALLASAFFAFDPNLIENSIFGITEPLFILCGILSIFFVLSNKTRYFILGALFAGFSLDIRLNGIVLFIILTIICFTTGITKKEKMKKFLIFLIIFTIAASPFFIQSYVGYGNPFSSIINLTQGIQTNVAPSLDASLLESDLSTKFRIALTEEFKHIFRVAIPYLALFVPLGLVSMFVNSSYNKKIIFLTVIVSLIIAIPQYTLSLEYRNLFFILPMFSVIGALGIQHILSNNSHKNLFLVLLVGGIILLSYNMLRDRSDVDLELLKEKEMFGKYVAASFKGKMMGDYYTQISHHLPQAKLLDDELGGQVRNENLLLFGSVKPSKTMIDTMKWAEERQIIYFVIDDIYEARAPEFVEVYYNEEEYPYLNKVFDSTENDYRKLRVKIFEIDYNKLE